MARCVKFRFVHPVSEPVLQVLVWKEMEYGKMNEKEKQQLVSEVNILRLLNHPNIVRYYDRVIDRKEQKIYVVMEYCSGGDLAQYIKQCAKQRCVAKTIRLYKTDPCTPLQTLHGRRPGVEGLCANPVRPQRLPLSPRGTYYSP